MVHAELHVRLEYWEVEVGVYKHVAGYYGMYDGKRAVAGAV